MRCPKTIAKGLLAACVWLVQSGLNAAELKSVEPFALRRWGENTIVRLDDFAGEIVVLDFFAHWCVPCLQTSADVERYIQQAYEQTGGNPAGRKVRCLSVNVDQSAPGRTREFIRKAGLRLATEDNDGQLFKALRGTALPYIVILENTRADGRWVVRYARAGFEGAAKLRAVIDQIGADKTEPRASSGPSEPIPRIPVERSLELDIEAMRSSDVVLLDSGLAYRENRPTWDFGLNLAESYLGLDYRPATYELIGHRDDVEENRIAARLNAKWRPAPPLTLLTAGGVYEGFSDYRSLWLSEFYRQRFGRLLGYEEPRPHGYDIAPGVRWEYLPASGFLQAGFIYQQDEVAPAYEKPIGLPLRHRTSGLETRAGHISLENVIARRVRSLLEFQVTDTTERELRFSYQGRLNWAFAPNWVARTVASGSHEAPGFCLWSSSVSLERDWNDTWFAGLFGRHYRDSGEFSQALPESTAAPGLETWQAGASVRWQTERFAVKLAAGPYFSSYGSSAVPLNAFEYLYRTRSWFAGQIALRYTF